MITDTTSMNASFGYWVRRRRKALDLTQEQLAARINCSNALIRKIEADERRPSLEIAELLAKALAIDPAEHPAFLRVARGERAVTHLDKIAEPTPALQTQPAATGQPTAATPPPSNLPLPPNPLVGRLAELGTLAQLLRDPQCRLLTIAGAGGMGKTRLAIALAQQAQADFVDGAFFVNLAAVARPELIAAAIAAAIGLTFAGPAQQESQVINYLRHKQMLLLLDNFEHLLDGAAIVSGLLASAPKLKVLTTSREPLEIQAEWVFTLDGLTNAVELFVQRARQAQVGFRLTRAEETSVGQICQLVEGMPLAIELAATWVRTLTCAEIAQQIEQDVNFLMTTVRDLPPRHRSITAVFDHSWQLLNTTEQQALIQLSVFQGGFRREAAQVVANASLPILSALVTKSLVRVVDGHYDLHELVRQLVASRFPDEAAVAATRRRHAEYYLGLLHKREAALKGTTQLQVVEEFKREVGNFRLAWAAGGQYQLWQLLFEALRCYWAFCDMQGMAREGSAETERLIQQLQNQADTPEKQRSLGRLLCYCGIFYFRHGDNGRAHDYLTQSIQVLRTLGDPALLIDPLIFHGVVLFITGNPEPAGAALAEGLAHAEAAHEQWFVALALLNQGYLASIFAPNAEIYAKMQRALAIWRQLGGLRTIALALNYLSPVAIQLGQIADAQQYLQESLTLAQQLGDDWLIGTAHSHRAMLAQAQGDLEQAEGAFHQAIAIFRERRLQWDLCVALVYLGEVQMQRGETAVARRNIIEGLQLTASVRAVLTALAALLDFASLLPASNAEQGLEIVLFVLQHPAKNHRLQQQGDSLQAALMAQLTPAQVEQTQARIPGLSLDTVVAKILNHDAAHPIETDKAQ